MSSPSRILEEGGGRRFRLEGRRRSEPKRLNPGCSNQIQGFWPKRTQASYLPWNLSVKAEIGPFFSKFECGIRPSDQGLGSLESSMLTPPRPNRLATSHMPKVRRSGWDACATQSPGRMALRRPRISGLPLEVKSDTCLTIPSHHVIES